VQQAAIIKKQETYNPQTKQVDEEILRKLLNKEFVYKILVS
jgi:hypothetical protein